MSSHPVGGRRGGEGHVARGFIRVRRTEDQITGCRGVGDLSGLSVGHDGVGGRHRGWVKEWRMCWVGVASTSGGETDLAVPDLLCPSLTIVRLSLESKIDLHSQKRWQEVEFSEISLILTVPAWPILLLLFLHT